MKYQEIKAKFQIKHESADTCKAICPNHEDRQASLTISYNKAERKTLLYCHAGCETREILSKVSLKLTDLFEESGKTMNRSDKNSIEAVYQYRAADNTLLFEKVRFASKNFAQRRYVDGAEVWGLEEGIYYEVYKGSKVWSKRKRTGVVFKKISACTPVIYRLPEVIAAVRSERPVFIVEGEKDADNLARLELTATCNFDGASLNVKRSKWRSEYCESFKGAQVIILSDNDEPGRIHAESIAAKLYGIAKSIKLVELHGLPEKGDVSDWLEAGGTKEELFKIIEKTESYKGSNQSKVANNRLVFEDKNCYCKLVHSGPDSEPKIVPISNFILEPIEKLQSENVNLLKAIVKTDKGKEFTRVFDIRNDFMSGHTSFKRALNDMLIFTGKDRELEDIKGIIIDKDFLTKKGIESTGFHFINGRWVFVSRNKVVDENFNEALDCSLLSRFNNPLDSELIEVEALDKSELKVLSEKLFKFNSLSIVSTLIGFAASTLLKEKLWKERIKFNHLFIVGEAGAGKSSSVEMLLMNLLGMNSDMRGAERITHFTVEKDCSSTNYLPFVIDEFKPSKMRVQQIALISDTLRNSYGNIAVEKGKRDQTVNTYVLKSPIVLIGEDFVDETAVIERGLKLNFTKLSRKGKEKTQAFNFLQSNALLLKKLGRALLEEALKLSCEELLEIHEAAQAFAYAGDIQTDRVRNSVANCICGIELLNMVFEKLELSFTETGYEIEEIKETICNAAKEEILGGNANVRSAVDIMLEKFDTMADADSLVKDFHYKVNGKKLYLHLRRIFYTAETELKMRMEVSQKEFSNQLKTQDYCINHRTSIRLVDEKSKAFVSKRETTSYKVFELDLDKLVESGIEVDTFVRKGW